MGEHRQRYNEEFKKQTVQFIQEQTKTVGGLAEELNIPKSTLHQWSICCCLLCLRITCWRISTS
ncbi:transposase [Paenibacillus odorifer]|uniref:transposase n=1 Tax=Paenibacillus TaxID=44249 RepID=UPI00096D24D5